MVNVIFSINAVQKRRSEEKQFWCFHSLIHKKKTAEEIREKKPIENSIYKQKIYIMVLIKLLFYIVINAVLPNMIKYVDKFCVVII